MSDPITYRTVNHDVQLWNRLNSNGVITLRRPFEMTDPSESSDRHPLSYRRVAWQSALAACLGLGLPIALMFWVLILSRLAPSKSIDSFLSLLQNTWYPFANESQPSTPVHDFLMVLQIYVRPDNIILVLGILGWALLLSRISGYRQWGWILAAGLAGVFIGKAPIDWLDGWIQQSPPLYGWPVHIRFAIFLSLSVLCVAMATGLALGLVLRNAKASLILAAASGVTSVIAVIAADLILEMVGLRVGHGNLAMPKLTAVGTMAAAIAVGTVLGVLFTHYYREQRTDSAHAAYYSSANINP
jgi:hypothetical protein